MFCGNCGTELDQERCPNCGYVNIFMAYSKVNSAIKEPDVKPAQTKSKKKTARFYIIISTFAVILIAAGCFLTLYFMKDMRYKEAINYLESDKPKQAAARFEELGNYKDSEGYLEEADKLIAYNKAIDTYEDQDYKEALKQFEDLGGFEDSEEYAQLCRNHISYKEARSLFDSNYFEQAITIFLSLGDFEDSLYLASCCQQNIDYKKAQSLYVIEDYEAALPLFEALSEFKDSKGMAYMCSCLIKLDEALNAYSTGDYNAALKLLKEVEDEISGPGIDISSIIPIEQIRYLQGQCYYYQELYYSAYNAFNAAGDYMDASEMAESCIQPIPEQVELYRHEDYRAKTRRFRFIWTKETDYYACVMIYKNDLLISVVFAERGEVRAWYPHGTYYFEIFYGDRWFGEKEKFGTPICDESFTKTTPTTMSTKIYLGQDSGRSNFFITKVQVSYAYDAAMATAFRTGAGICGYTPIVFGRRRLKRADSCNFIFQHFI